MSEPTELRDPVGRAAALGGAVLILGLIALAADALPRVPDLLTGGPVAGSEVGNVLRDLARLVGVLLSMLVGLTAIAVPLTANVYTPKLIELFVADRVNRLALGFYVLSNAVIMWNAFVVFDGTTGLTRQRAFLCLALALAALALLVPYASYVLRFLVPRSIICRLEAETARDLHAACHQQDPRVLQELRQRVLDDIQYLGKIALRSVDRFDRDTVYEGLAALQRVFDAYQARKQYLPAGWHEHTREETQGLGPEVIQETRRQRAGIELAILSELSLILPLAIGRLPEVVARVAIVTRRFGVRASERGDVGAREQVTLFFNTFLRTALQRAHPDTFYKFIYQYRRFAEALLERDPDHARRIAFFFDYYGHQAVRMNLGYLINVVAYDLASLAESAAERRSPCASEILGILLELDRDSDGLIQMPGVIKAQLILAAKLLTRGDQEPARELRTELAKVPRERLAEAFRQIMSARDENFWEIADRRRHLDHVEPRYRAALEGLREDLLGKRAMGRKTAEFLRPTWLLDGEPEPEPEPEPADAPPPPPSDAGTQVEAPGGGVTGAGDLEGPA